MINVSATTDRSIMTARLAAESFDLVVVGGGATGLGVALDAVLRGLRVALLESHDFAKGTSSRATKLIHGGVRYLAQGQVGLVRESLRERTALLHNAPGLVKPLAFVVPAYRYWELPFYAAGLKLYEALAGPQGLGSTRVLNTAQALNSVPGVRRQGLKGGVEYWDAQFDDARLAVALACSAAARGAVMLNYFPVTGLFHDEGKVCGVQAHDAETGRQFTVRARCVVNATGVWVDELRRRDAEGCGRSVQVMVKASRGTHLVVDRCFFPSDAALLVPRTNDRRVLFIVPWLGRVLLGTTDVSVEEATHEPHPAPAEVDYILQAAARYLQKPPARSDVKSVWAGLRPLVSPAFVRHEVQKPFADGAPRPMKTARISREHAVEVSSSGLVTVAGGKWTTYRAMAQDVLEACTGAGLLPDLPPCTTHGFSLEGALGQRVMPAGGGEQDVVQAGGVSEALVKYLARHEFARTVEDVLARRVRLLFLDAALAAKVAPDVAQVLQAETGFSSKLDSFLKLAQDYRLGS